MAKEKSVKKSEEVKSSGKSNVSASGKVVQFRRGLKRITPRHFILNFSCKNREEASKLIGKEVEWKSPAGKVLKGKVSGAHGNKGLVRAIFERGLPGQAINTEIKLS
jgi:large subunit ribosomal protein L35Ae